MQQAHPVFSASDRRLQSWSHLAAPASSCTSSLEPSSLLVPEPGNPSTAEGTNGKVTDTVSVVFNFLVMVLMDIRIGKQPHDATISNLAVCPNKYAALQGTTEYKIICVFLGFDAPGLTCA